MADNKMVLYKISEALIMDYASIYYVDANTNEYYYYSVDREHISIKFEYSGSDFFKDMIRDIKTMIYDEDQHIFQELFDKDRLLNAINRGKKQSIEYRLLINGIPTWHSLCTVRSQDVDTDFFVLGVINIDKEYKHRKDEEEIERQKNIYDQITTSLAAQYDTLYYIDLETDTYVEISSTDEYKKLNIPATGKNFFAESRRSIRKFVHPEDRDVIMNYHYKDAMLEKLKYRNTFSIAFRMVIDGQVRHIRHHEMMSKDKKHLIVCIENIDAEVKAKLAYEESEKKSQIYSQIAESLASHFDLIYYVECSTSHFMEFSTKKIYGELGIREEGDDFFNISHKNADKIIYHEDRERLKLFLNKDNFISQLDKSRQLVIDYRMVIDGIKPRYTRMTVLWSSDKSHFIICIENREEDVKKEKERLKALTLANEMARRDDLKGCRNVTAYHEMEKELSELVKDNKDYAFGMVVCDINDLKMINDTQGHKSGDEYIKESCKMIRRIFSHSPIFRVGGDEFVVVLRGHDYDHREALISQLHNQVEDHLNIGEGPIVASGLAEYQPYKDSSVTDVFNRADSEMYENKTALKEEKLFMESRSLKERSNFRAITDDRRKLLEGLYKSFEVVAEGTYVFICDMQYDFSKWSKNAVDRYGLPSEYMYGAGDIWENHIHPEDRDEYHKGIDEIFSGNISGHDMQYRAKRTDGEYDVCTCRGVVLRDLNGEPEYFAGTIRNHGIQGHIDTLTGLRNQYGFFEDLDTCINRESSVNVLQIGISKFSEINEIYGYHFGNRVLQQFARKVYETTGNTGHTYRLDGTKFAVISNTLSLADMKEKYDGFKDYCREWFSLDDRKILLEVNCGALELNNFDVDSQTVYGCLNFAYVESKAHHQGEMIDFRNDLNDRNRQRLEKLHAIRSSIMRGYSGFYLMYQPVVDANTEKLIGAEALLRWENEKYGIVPPNQFIPLLETDPLFPELGEWIIREALFAAKQILKDDPEFIMNVNLSYTQLEKPDFVDMVMNILKEMQYPPEHLCFEVTERCRLMNIEQLKNVTANLKSRGILIALDDFGTGFSSVDIVKELPFDIIKIDRGFVDKIEDNEVDRQLIKHFAGIASIFGAKVCVEGVETEGMRDILKRYDVKSFQGYYYAKPLMLEQFFAWKKEKYSGDV